MKVMIHLAPEKKQQQQTFLLHVTLFCLLLCLEHFVIVALVRAEGAIDLHYY